MTAPRVGTIRPVSTPIYRPKLRSVLCSNPVPDRFKSKFGTLSVLGNLDSLREQEESRAAFLGGEDPEGARLDDQILVPGQSRLYMPAGIFSRRLASAMSLMTRMSTLVALITKPAKLLS